MIGVRRLFGTALAAAVVVAFAAPGCGSGSTTTETDPASSAVSADHPQSNLVPVVALTPQGVEGCLENQGNATVISSKDLNPGSPINAHGVFAMASDSGARIGIILTLKPFITDRLSRELAEEGEYQISVTPSEEAVVVLDQKATAADEALASECSEPS